MLGIKSHVREDRGVTERLSLHNLMWRLAGVQAGGNGEKDHLPQGRKGCAEKAVLAKHGVSTFQVPGHKLSP